MIEGYELEQEANEILQNDTILSVRVDKNEDFGYVFIVTDKHKIKITSIGGHGGVGMNFYEIQDK
jgi:hypothetical protein